MLELDHYSTRRLGAAFTSRNRLTVRPSWADTGDVPKKEGAGFSSPNYQRRTTATRRYFFVRFAFVRLQWAAMAGRLRPAGFLWYRSANPAICRPPRLAASGGLTATKGGHMPSTVTPIRSSSEQISQLAQIATVIGSMLGACDILSPNGQADAIAVSARMADDLAKALTAIVGEAA